MKLSILIPTVPRRLHSFFPSMVENLQGQIGDQDIEILGFYDNKRRSVGAKRNSLLQIANGEYVTFIDDDDEVTPDYVSEIMNGIADSGPDVVVYDVICTINNGRQQYCRYGVEYEYHEEGDDWYGKPAHTHVWRREIAKQGIFPETNFSEDMNWVKQVWPLVRQQLRISKVLYHYNFNDAISETRNG